VSLRPLLRGSCPLVDRITYLGFTSFAPRVSLPFRSSAISCRSWASANCGSLLSISDFVVVIRTLSSPGTQVPSAMRLRPEQAQKFPGGGKATFERLCALRVLPDRVSRSFVDASQKLRLTVNLDTSQLERQLPLSNGHPGGGCS
jgi:hypothetical protein